MNASKNHDVYDTYNTIISLKTELYHWYLRVGVEKYVTNLIIGEYAEYVEICVGSEPETVRPRGYDPGDEGAMAQSVV